MTVPKVTSVDVARLAGVHQSTVSRTFSKTADVAPETRARVESAAQQLNYTPNAIARSLITQRTHMVGIVMASMTSPFQPYVLEMFVQQLQRAGKQALVFSAAAAQEVDDILPTALQYRVDALIITSATLSSARIADCVRNGTDVIFFNRYMTGERVSAICCDNVAGGRAVADFLLDSGRTRLAYIAGRANSSTNRDREAGFRARLRERRGPHEGALLRAEADYYTYEAGYAAARSLCARADRPDAVFCASDILALGAMDYARDHGIAVPDALAVVGFDDIPMANWSSYALTTVRQPVEAMIDATIALLQGPPAPPQKPVIRFFPGTLIERQSAQSRR